MRNRQVQIDVRLSIDIFLFFYVEILFFKANKFITGMVSMDDFNLVRNPFFHGYIVHKPRSASTSDSPSLKACSKILSNLKLLHKASTLCVLSTQ